jgi:N-terminal half of MaoC dehydratase
MKAQNSQDLDDEFGVKNDGHVGAATMRISNLDVLRFALSIGISDPEYLEALRDPYREGQPAPPTFYLTLAMTSNYLLPRNMLGIDGLPLMKDSPAPRVTAGETRVQIFHRIRVGDFISVTERVISDEPKRGKSGTFIVQSLERLYQRQDGVLVTAERYSRILRPDQ